MDALATVADLETRLGLAAGSLTGTDLARAEAALDDASALVRAEAGLDWVDAYGASTAPASVVVVVVQVALRVYRNPDGYISESIAGAYSYAYGQGAQNGLTLTDAERRIITRAAAADGGTGGLVSVYTPSAYGSRPRVAGWEASGGSPNA